MYSRTERVDGTLIADVQRLGAEIEEDDPRYQGGSQCAPRVSSPQLASRITTVPRVA